jgi:DNA-binding transcriptional LysR family regulator
MTDGSTDDAASIGHLRAPARLNLRQLEAFAAVVTAGSVTGAARLLNVSQPGVSRLLTDLERAAGFRLFQRERGRLVITPEGTALHEEIARTLQGIGQIERAASEIRAMRRGHLRIAVMPAFTFDLVPPALAAFMARHPELRLTFEARNSRTILDAVAGQRVDLGVTQLRTPQPGVAVLGSWRSDCVCVMQPGHPLARRTEVRAADIAAHALVALPPESIAGRSLAAMMAAEGFAPAAQTEALTSHAACALAAEGLGVAVVDAFTAAIYGARLLARPVRPVVNFGFQVVAPAERPLSRAAEAFLATLRDHLAGDPRVRAEEAHDTAPVSNCARSTLP